MIAGLLVGYFIGSFYNLNEEQVPIRIINSIKWNSKAFMKTLLKRVILTCVSFFPVIFSKSLEKLWLFGFKNDFIIYVQKDFLKEALIFLGYGIGIGFILSISDFFKETNVNIVQISKPYQRFRASMKVLHFSIFQHFHLRYLLYEKGLLPFKLVTFLNAMSERHFLETDGATWRFRHKILQDYFAKVWVEESERKN